MRGAIRYARNGDVSLAYQVVGEGDRDLVVTGGWVPSFTSYWEDPASERFVERLARLGRVILWDKRGTGLSDRVSAADLPSLEERSTDLVAVMDAAGVGHNAVLLGLSEGALFAATTAALHPERAGALCIYGGWAVAIADDGFPSLFPSPEASEKLVAAIGANWGDSADFLHLWAPSVADDPAYREGWNRSLVQGASPAAALEWLRFNTRLDIREVLRGLNLPTLVLHRTGDRVVPVACGRAYAGLIPGAHFVEMPGDDHLWWVGDADAVVDEVEEFLLGTRATRDAERLLATVLFTDIVGSTSHAATVGDHAWRELIERHDRVARASLQRFGGREIKTLGDGLLAAFDSPARAIRCAVALRDAIGALDIEVRMGIHTGECERLGDDLRGMAVNIGARVAAKAGPNEVLVSGTVHDLVLGSDIAFADRGTHELKGVPGDWRLYAVTHA